MALNPDTTMQESEDTPGNCLPLSALDCELVELEIRIIEPKT